ncbi:MAG TPA: hypothetical protein VGZ01_01285 [Trinickia sp.]|nr:hypothetical protein [Trinickia sp.]
MGGIVPMEGIGGMPKGSAKGLLAAFPSTVAAGCPAICHCVGFASERHAFIHASNIRCISALPAAACCSRLEEVSE